MTATEAGAGRCPHCASGAPAGANFCPACGGSIRGPDCPGCGAPSGGADGFCTQCGERLPGGAAGGRGRMAGAGQGAPGAGPGRPSAVRSSAVPWTAWTVAGVLLLGLVTVLVLRWPDRAEAGAGAAGQPTASGPAPLGPTAAVDLTSMTPREAAERLFRRVMSAAESGNQTEADRFLPMAIAAYDRIGALTLDDRFHLSVLHAAGGDGTQALAVAEAGLAIRPTHLLCLASAAEGALMLGDSARAESHYRTFVASYEGELQSGLTEYVNPELGHPGLLPFLLQEAEDFLETRP